MAQQQDEGSDPEDDSDEDDWANTESEEDSELDDEYVPKLKPKRAGLPRGPNRMGSKRRPKARRVDANYTFCPLPHRLSIL